MPAAVPGLSVIIATYDRAALLRGALYAIARQRDPGVPVEVVVCDNASPDDTRGVFDEVSSTRPHFRWVYVREARPGKSVAVNTALGRAHGQWFVFTDDDVRPEPGWLAALADAFALTDPDFVVGRILPIWERPAPRWLTPPLYGVLAVPDNGETALELGPGVNEHIMPIGTNMAVHRRAVLRVGGFRPDLGKMRGTLRTGEDHEFYLRLVRAGCRGVYVPTALVRHLVPASRLNRSYFRRWFYQNGRNVATLEASYPPRAPMLLGLPRYKWRKAAGDLVRLGRATLTADRAARFANAVDLLWFVGYVRERWFGKASTPASSVRPEPPNHSHASDLGVRA